MLRVLEVASSALAILLFQRLPSSVIARKNLPFGGCHVGTFFAAFLAVRTMEKSFLLRHVGVKNEMFLDYDLSMVLLQLRGSRKWRLKEEGSVGRCLQ